MVHEEFVRIVPGADTAVLLIHGICGSPIHFRELIPLQDRIPEKWSVYNMLLDGHGGDVADFAAASMDKWKTQVWSVYEKLAKDHRHILLVGHSMGTLFAIQLAAQYPEKVKKLFLLAVPMRPWLKPTMIIDLILMVFGKLENAPPHRVALAKAAGIRTTRKLWAYIPWIPRFLELFREICRTERVLDGLKSECCCYQSRKDELVLSRSEKILEKNSMTRITRLNGSSHFYYCPKDRERVLEDFEKWIKEESHD